MNNARRKEISDIAADLAKLKARVEQIHEDEEQAFQAMPESLQQTPNGQKSEAAASALDDAVNAFDELYGHLFEAVNGED